MHLSKVHQAVSVTPAGVEGLKPAATSNLSITLAIRTDDFGFYRERLRFRDNCNLMSIDTVLVDDGSPLDVSQEIEAFCQERGWKYVFLDTRDQDFSLARARNAGILAAETEWVFTDDADNIYERDFFQRLLNEIAVLDETPFSFLTVPHIYLSSAVSATIRREQDLDRLVPWILSQALLENPRGNDTTNVVLQHYAPASAMLAVRKRTAMLVGGYDETFEGWGGEDRDFVFRLLLENPKIKLPSIFEQTKKWNLNDTHVFEGWRSLYRILGEYMGRKGFYAYHLYHDWNSWRTHDGSNASRDMAADRASYYSSNRKVPCLHLPSMPRDVIIGFNPFVANYRVRETLGNPILIDDPQALEPEHYVSEVLVHPVNSVIFWNPYGSDWKQKVYKEFIAQGITPIVAERGALPNTVCFDKGGLCVESDSYHESNWARTLTEQEVAVANKHIAGVRYGTQALEKQSDRLGAWNIRKKIGISDATKVFLAPLQLYDDTVTTFFCEEGRTYKDYIDTLNRLSVSLPKDWVFLYKNHPLSIKKTPFQGGICVDDYHINDLIEAADLVSVFNSGVGLLAQAFEKPVLYYGRCFYAIEGVNWRFETVHQALSFLGNLPSPDMDKVRQFYYYLNEEFYSFAEMQSGVKKGSKLSMRADLKKVTYRTIRIPGFAQKDFSTEVFDPYYSPLFDVYRHAAITRGAGLNSSSSGLKTAQSRINRKTSGRSLKLTSAKWRKLKRNPQLFFSDSNLPVLRPMRHFFKDIG